MGHKNNEAESKVLNHPIIDIGLSSKVSNLGIRKPKMVSLLM
jgi:hypothetical protein